MNTTIIIVLFSVIVLSLAFLIFLFSKKSLSGSKGELGALMERLNNLSEQNRQLRTELDLKLSETHRSNQEQFSQTSKIVQDITSQSARLITDVSKKLTKLDETNKQVVDFSAQLQSLQDILKNPKQRGILGEYFLEQTLKNVLPPGGYQMQYKIGRDEATGRDLIVDAAVFVNEKVVPIDAKFSLENYERIQTETNELEREKLEQLFNKDLKARIDETAKYVLPDKNTMEFAFMFIPSEAIYYDLLVNKVAAKTVSERDLVEYAFRDKKVIIVSPTSFMAYLQTVLQGLKAMQIEEKTKEITKNIEKLGTHISSYDEFMKKLGNSMSTTVNHYNNAYREFNKIDKDITRVTGEKSGIEILKIDRPNNDIK